MWTIVFGLILVSIISFLVRQYIKSKQQLSLIINGRKYELKFLHARKMMPGINVYEIVDGDKHPISWTPFPEHYPTPLTYEEVNSANDNQHEKSLMKTVMGPPVSCKIIFPCKPNEN